MTHEELSPYYRSVEVYGVATGPGPVFTVVSKPERDAERDAAQLGPVNAFGRLVSRKVQHCADGWRFTDSRQPCPNTGKRR